MKFSAPLSIGTNTGATGTTLAITVGAGGVPAGATIFVLVTEKSTSGTDGTLADTAGNSYSKITSGSLNAAIANGRGILFAVTNCKALVNTNTITYTRNLSGASCAMSAFYTTGATGAATFTEALATATGSTGTITVTSGSLGAGRLVLGALFASGTSVAGGNATFTNAASFTTPPIEARTGGSGGSRVDGGQLFKAATGTQVYAPTLSSTAQVWFLAVLGVIPPPDTIDLTEPGVALPRLPAKPFDPPNLLLTTLPPPPVVDTTHILRSPLYARLPDPKSKASGEAVAGVAPLLTPNPRIPFNQDLWEGAAKAWPKVVGEAIGVTPPPFPFSQNDWLRQPAWPKAVGEAIGTLSPLLTPNPAQPFAQLDWYQITFTKKAKVDDPPNLELTTLTPPPFAQFDWYRINLTTKAKVDDPPNLQSSTLKPPPPVTPVFRSPLFVQIYPRIKAQQEYTTNLVPLYSVVVVQNPFWYRDEDARSFAIAKAPAKAAEQPITPVAPLLTPNPPQPFNQDIWDSATRAWPKAYAEPFGTLNPLLTPNPPQPFNQYEWRNTARVPLSLKSDVTAGSAALLTPPLMFLQYEYALSVPQQKAKVDEPFNLTIYIATVVPVQNPFYYRDERSTLTARAPAAQKSDSYDPPDTLLYPNPPRPFHQDLWEGAVKAWPKVVGEVVGTLSPILTPNPPQPFVQSDWFQIRSTQKAKVDDPFNLTIYLPTVVVTFTISLLDQFNWPNPTLPRAKANVDNSIAPPAPLLTPNPPQPFHQNIWDSATPAKPKAYAEPVAGIAPLLTPNPPQPFNQDLWENAARTPPKSIGDVLASPNPIIYPNPPQPFTESDWTRILKAPPVRVDDVVNLLPLQTTVVTPQNPFYYYDEDARSFAIARAPAAQKSDVYRGPPPLLTPNPPQPFKQGDWPSGARAGPSDRSFNSIINLPLITPPAPPVTGLPHNQPFINASVGRMFGR